MIKYFMLITCVVSLSGCATVSKYITDFTDVSCKKQIEISTASIEAAADGVFKAYQENVINTSDKNKAMDEFTVLTDELVVLNNKCDTQPELAKAKAKELEIK